MWYWIIALVAVAAVGVALLYRRSARRLAEEARQLSTIAALEHDTSYRLACELYGKEAVDASIRRASARGVS